jgi:hypothetical protein
MYFYMTYKKMRHQNYNLHMTPKISGTALKTEVVEFYKPTPIRIQSFMPNIFAIVDSKLDSLPTECFNMLSVLSILN